MITKTVCIIGLSPSSRELAFNEPEGTEMWGLNNSHHCFSPEQLARFTAWFQIHERSEFTVNNTPDNHGDEQEYIRFLQSLAIPVYMEEYHEDIPSSVRYPREEIVRDIVTLDYFTSTIAFMLALAIHKSYQEIHIYGVDMNGDTEYVHERPCVEFYIGIAIARGVKVVIPENSPVLKGPKYATTIMLPSTLVRAHHRAYSEYKKEEDEQYNQSVGEVKVLEALAKARPDDPLIAEMLETKIRERELHKGQFNAYSGGCTALSELLIDALRPVSEEQKQLRTISNGLILVSTGVGGSNGASERQS